MAPVRYLALGDSYTIGEGVDIADTWPVRLLEQLAAGAFWPDRPDVVARTGWTADELLAALDHASLAPPYDLVTVLIGVNDQYRDREVAEHLPHFNTLLSHAISHADGDSSRVLVVSIPDWGATGFAAGDERPRESIASAIDAYNDAQRELCELRGIAYADITPMSRLLASIPGMLVGDALHPSAVQYARWLDVIVPAAKRCLA